MEVELQGSYTGVKKYKEMKNPDILYSKIDKKDTIIDEMAVLLKRIEKEIS